MRRGAEELDERFTAFVRSRGEHHLRMATLLTGNQDAAQDLVQASLLKLYRAWSRIDTSGGPDAYLFSDFGIRFSVSPPPASQIDHKIGVAIQF